MLLVAQVPLLVLFALYVTTLVLEQITHNYILPQQDLQDFTSDYRRETELTYYHRICDVRDVSATDTAELVIDYATMTPNDAMRHQLKHGASVYPNLLSEETANEVRNWILEQNQKNEDMIPVIENDNRWSFAVKVDQHPTVEKTLNELLSHEFLVTSLEKIMGTNPAVIELTAITSAPGAAVQRYHADVIPIGNAVKWGRNFVPSYSLFVPLQNVSGAMGATEICPGSHMCADGCFDYCPDRGLQLSGKADIWPLGWGALLNQQLMHRGAAHADPNGPLRVLFIITFAPRPRFGPFQVEMRSIGQGGSYSLHWTQWGHTLADFRKPSKYMQQPWRLLRSLGIYKPPNSEWGWDYVTHMSARMANQNTVFFREDWNDLMEQSPFDLIPKSLLRKLDEMDLNKSGRELWNEFFMDALINCRVMFKDAYILFGLVYFASATFLLLIFSRRRNFYVSVALSFAAAHVLTVFLAGLTVYIATNSTFAKSIRFRKPFSWPSLPINLAPELAGTLPTREDIMIFDDMQSDYLASFNEVLEVFHPGNLAWASMLWNYSLGYDNLPSSLKAGLCLRIIHWTQQQGRRILVKNSQNSWAEADPALQLRLCHKDIMKKSNPYLHFIIQHIDNLRSEAKYGHFRNTKMHQRWVPEALLELQTKLISFNPASIWTTIALETAANDRNDKNIFLAARFKFNPLQQIARSAPMTAHLRPVKVSEELEVDLSDAWIQEGDQVEGAYGETMTGR